MKNKKDAQFFKELNKKTFYEFMQEYTAIMAEYNQSFSRCNESIYEGQDPSKNHLYKMRQKSIDVEKFGKQFRERTIQRYKNQKKAKD